MIKKFNEFHGINENDSNDDINKKDKGTYDYGCLMLEIDNMTDEFIKDNNLFTHSTIPIQEVYMPEDPQYGYETEPHCTLLFGLHNDIEDGAIAEYVKTLSPVTITLRGISAFKNEEYDVLKYDIDGEDIFRINKEITSKFPYTTDYPDYHPHSTIAYLLPGMSDKYVKSFDEPIIIENLNIVKYSKADGTKMFFTLEEKI